MSSFDFWMPHEIDGHRVNEIDGRCTVERDGSLSIQFYVSGTKYSTLFTPNAEWVAKTEAYLTEHCAGDLEDARAELRADLRLRETERV